MTVLAQVDDRGYIRPEIAHLAVPIHTIHTYPGNARRGHQQKIRDSLLTHGQYKPLLVQRSTGYVVVGNNTLTVMRQQGYTHAAVQYLDLDDVAARKLLLMDNRTSDLAHNDTAELVALLAELPEYAGTGYWELDVDGMLAELQGGVALDSLPSLEDALPVSPAGPPLPDRATADPMPIPAPGPAPTPVPAPDPIPVPPPIPPADPRTAHPDNTPDNHPDNDPDTRTTLPPVLPPTPRPPGPAADATVPWNLELPRTDRDEAHRLIAHARGWLDEPGITTTDVILRGLRTLAAVGDARHNPATTVSVAALLMAAGRDPLRNL